MVVNNLMMVVTGYGLREAKKNKLKPYWYMNKKYL